MERTYENYCSTCVDWLRGVVPVTDVNKFVDGLSRLDARLSSENFLEYGAQMLNYKVRYVHKDVQSLTFGFNPITIAVDGSYPLAADKTQHNNPYVLFSLSGDAIRYLGDKTLKKVFKYLYGLQFVCTRIDYALDITDSTNHIVPLLSEALENFILPEPGELTIKAHIKRTPKNMQIHQYKYPLGSDCAGYEFKNYTLGHHGSAHGMFRLYNKHFECLYGRNARIGEQLLNGRDYWWRAELELHNNNKMPWAFNSFNSLVENDFAVAVALGNGLNDFFDLVYAYHDDRRMDLSKSCIEWDEFINWLSNSMHLV